MVFEGVPAVKLHTKNVEVGTSANGNLRQDKSPWGGFTFLDLLTSKALCFVRIQYHAPVMQPSFELEETRPKDQHHYMCQDQEADGSSLNRQ